MDWDLVTIFAFVIILIAVRGHYRQREKQGAGMATSDQTALSNAMDVARRLEQRVESLERLLDEDSPGWRARARA
ncbi:MAG TPA: envelope stress response membrane protein PspB [Acetobacteraceae bacterium]|nr:envelope stress response membrane protein PspB [Acetobacteraceae bacterium]